VGKRWVWGLCMEGWRCVGLCMERWMRVRAMHGGIHVCVCVCVCVCVEGVLLRDTSVVTDF
jgi:hypothetical protein